MRTPDGIKLYLCEPNSLHVPHPASKLLKDMTELGCQFLLRTGDPDPQPEQNIDKRGAIIIPYPFRHALLASDLTAKSLGMSKGVARLGYVSDGNCAMFSQTPRPTQKSIDALALGQVEFAKLLYTRFRPAYGWIDESSEIAEPIANPTASDIKYFFWANIYGPQIVREFGPQLLSRCPAARKEQLDDGGMLIVATDSYMEWFNEPPIKLTKYMHELMPAIEIYQSAGIP